MSQLLVRWSSGDETAFQELISAVYDELRRLGRSALRVREQESVLQQTALVHEAWIRIASQKQVSMDCRRQFYGLAAKVMRDILVDHSRRRHAAKRGGSQIEVPLDEANTPGEPGSIDFPVLEEAVTHPGAINARHSQIAELRYLAGLTIEESVEILGVSHATIEREWGFAHAWLRRELQAGRGLPAGALNS